MVWDVFGPTNSSAHIFAERLTKRLAEREPVDIGADVGPAPAGGQHRARVRRARPGQRDDFIDRAHLFGQLSQPRQ